MLQSMENFLTKVAALAAGPQKKPTIVEAVAAYDKDGVKRLIKLWKK